MDSQLNTMSKGDKSSGNQNRYNPRSKKKAGTPHVPDHPIREKKHAKDEENNNKENKTQSLSPTAKDHIPEVREVLKSPSSFNFEHEIQKIRILVPLSELVKNADFKRSLSKLLKPEPPCHPTNLVNL
jgi:hypothetical protein